MKILFAAFFFSCNFGYFCKKGRYRALSMTERQYFASSFVPHILAQVRGEDNFCLPRVLSPGGVLYLQVKSLVKFK